MLSQISSLIPAKSSMDGQAQKGFNRLLLSKDFEGGYFRKKWNFFSPILRREGIERSLATA